MKGLTQGNRRNYPYFTRVQADHYCNRQETNETTMNFPGIGLHVPTILLPKPGIDLTRWAVIACDQYTSQPEYWHEVERLVGDSPSTLHLTFPEIYLDAPDQEARIRRINETMRRYLDEGVLVPQKPGFILVDRQTRHVASRKGLVVALDLEHYDLREGSKTLIRATEGTIVERLPPRIKVRENAAIELPHIMVLIDDPEKTVIEPLFDQPLQPVYDVRLMMDGGRVRGWRIDDERHIRAIAEAIARLAGLDVDENLGAEPDILLYAMGDGNHSFATAKAIWERLKAESSGLRAVMDHPARFALVELVNLHDEGLEFEPIHRVLFKVDPEAVLQAMKRYYAEAGTVVLCQDCGSMVEVKAWVQNHAREGAHVLPYAMQGRLGVATLDRPRHTLEVASLQTFLDDFLKQNPAAEIDYVHGDDAVLELSAKPGVMGFFLPALSKYHLFESIAKDGALPRKTFSMGEADEKRFYLECRKIVP